MSAVAVNEPKCGEALDSEGQCSHGRALNALTAAWGLLDDLCAAIPMRPEFGLMFTRHPADVRDQLRREMDDIFQSHVAKPVAEVPK